ncbi:MAG: glycosyltransferase family 4 protein [Prevotella sp.]|nr:glycosyltransferase family 4 protein [Prevotella sp.]
MKVFHIVSNKEWGGGEQYVYDLAQRQLADGYGVELFCRPVEAVIAKFRELGIPVHALPLKGTLDLKSAFKMASHLKGMARCLVHAHNFKDAFTAAYARKLSGNKEARVIMSRHLTRTGKNSMLYRWLYRQLDWLSFDSEIARNEFFSTNPSMDKQRTGIIRTSIVLPEEVPPAGVRRQFDISADEVIGMFHGRLDPEKGLDALLAAAAQLRERPFRLVLVGRGSEEYTAHLKQSISDLQLTDKVVLAGFQHPVLPFVADADFGILASTVREGCPLSPQEYMSQGHTVVVTDNGGQREYVVDGVNGLLVPPGDADKLAAAMARLIDSKELRQQLGAKAKADFTEKLSYDHLYSQICELYERMA